MWFFSRLIRFECEEDDKPYFTDLGLDSDGLPSPGTKLGAFKSFDDLANKGEEKIVTLRRVCLSTVLASRTSKPKDQTY
jgi:hypothetical protein